MRHSGGHVGIPHQCVENGGPHAQRLHIRRLLRLADSYGEEALIAAVSRAQEYRRFDAHAVARILERNYPLLDDAPLAPLGGVGPILLGEVEAGSLDDYSRLDSNPTSTEADHKDDSEENHGS